MEKSVLEYLLNGMPMNEFKSWFILAMGGAFLFLVIRLIKVFGPEKLTKVKTPKWNWKYFFRGFLKLLATFLFAPWIILYFDDVVPTIFEFLFTMGSTNATGSVHQHITMELNGLSAFLTGFSIDMITHRISKTKFFNNGK